MSNPYHVDMALKSYRLKLPLDQADLLDSLAEKLRAKPAHLIRLAVEDWLIVIPNILESDLKEQLEKYISKDEDLTDKSDKLG